VTILATTGTQAMWYLTRGSGAVALVLLTLALALGVADVRRVRTPQLPRFFVDGLHRTLSLLSIVFVVVHVLTTVLDGFAPVSVIDAIIPFVSAYRPIWLGLGAIAFDLMLAVAITSLIRRRIGHRLWRGVHWASYGSWPIAVVHGFGSGSDARTGWLLALTVVCLLVVLTAALIRLRAGWPAHLRIRVAGLAASFAVPIFLIAWLPGGPLARGWSRRAGTPASLLGPRVSAAATSPSTAGGASAQTSSGSGSTASSPSAGGAATSFTASMAGSVAQGQDASGNAIVDIRTTVQGQQLDRLRIRLVGQPLPGGGVQMTSGRVTLGPSTNPDQFHGVVTGLQDTNVRAMVSDDSGTVLLLDAQLQVPAGGGPVSGTLQAAPR
jgi:sulfoxide reductase heme-binding subunit YedZ